MFGSTSLGRSFGLPLTSETNIRHPINNKLMYVQPNFNGSDTFGTMNRCNSEWLFELMSVNRSARSEGVTGVCF